MSFPRSKVSGANAYSRVAISPTLTNLSAQRGRDLSDCKQISKRSLALEQVSCSFNLEINDESSALEFTENRDPSGFRARLPVASEAAIRPISRLRGVKRGSLSRSRSARLICSAMRSSFMRTGNLDFAFLSATLRPWSDVNVNTSACSWLSKNWFSKPPVTSV